MKLKNICSPLFIVTVSLAIIISCKGKPTSVEQADGLSKTLIGYLPANTLAFHYWDFSLPGYQKYKSSNWYNSASSSSLVQSLQLPGNDSFSSVVDILKKNGVSLEDKGLIEEVFAEGALYLLARSATDNTVEVEYGAVTKAKNAAQLSNIIKSVKTFADQQQLQPLDLSIPGGSGFSLVLKDKYDPKQTVEVFVGQKNDIAAITSKKETLISILSTSKPASPAITNTDKYRQAVANIPGFDKLYGFGYADVEQLSSALSAIAQINPDAVKTLKAQPLSSLVYASAMEETPYSDALVSFKPDAGPNTLVRQLKQSSVADLTNSYGHIPSLMLSVDGQSLYNLLSLAAQMSEDQSVPLESFAAFKDISRLSILAKVTAPGQSFLPVPELLLAAASNKADDLQTMVKAVATPLLSFASPKASWQTKQIGGTTVSYVTTPLNIGVFMAVAKGHLFVTSSEQQLTTLLTGNAKQDTTLGAKLPAKAQGVLALQQSTLNFYLDFSDLVSFMQNMQGMLAAASQNDTLNKALEPKQLELLRSLGKLTASVSVQENAIRFQTAYTAGDKN